MSEVSSLEAAKDTAPPHIQIPPDSHATHTVSPSPLPGAPINLRRGSAAKIEGGVTPGNFKVSYQRKKLILCFDGTGNKFKGNHGDTNILKIFRMLDRSGGDHVHYYQPGIGTYITNGTLSRVHVGSRMKSWCQKAMDAAVGSSFDQHVMGGYKFLMRFYSPGDDIYMFGFSRGAYTARFLAEMLDHVGLVNQGNEEMVMFAWKTFSNWQQRRNNSEKEPLYNYMRAFRETFARPVRRVRFLGLFDTVNSVRRFESAWLKRSSGFPYTARSTARVIRHAVGIDERRAKFRQDLIDKVDVAAIVRHRSWNTGRKKNRGKKKKRDLLTTSTKKTPQHSNAVSVGNVNHDHAHPAFYHQHDQLASPESGAAYLPSSVTASMVSLNIFADQDSDSDDDEEVEQDIEEVWFPGCHGDIGGGWDLPPDEEPLSHGPLVWMVREARKAGVVFDKQRMKNQNCWLEEYEDDNLSSDSNDSLGSTQQAATNGVPTSLPEIEVTKASFTSPHPPVEKQPALDLHQAGEIAHPAHHPLRHILRRYRDRKPEAPKHNPTEYLQRAYTRGKIHDCLHFNNGISHVGVLGWRIMEYLPFRRMDLQPDGSWKAIVWPLPCGEVRDIPDDARVHVSVLKRMYADPTYRPGNLLVGGGGRGIRVAPEKYGTGEWEVLHSEGNPIAEVYMKRSAHQMKRKMNEHRLDGGEEKYSMS